MIRAVKPIVSSVWVCTGSTKESAVLSQARTMAADSAGIRKVQLGCNRTKTDRADKVKGKMSWSIYLHARRHTVSAANDVWWDVLLSAQHNFGRLITSTWLKWHFLSTYFTLSTCKKTQSKLPDGFCAETCAALCFKSTNTTLPACKIWKMNPRLCTHSDPHAPAHICRLLSRTGRGECIFLLTLTGGEVKPWGCCMTSAQQNWHDLSPATEHGDIHNILTGKSCGK